MKQLLYCIACEEEVMPQQGNPTEFVHEVWVAANLGGGWNKKELDWCEFPLGWATCAPPEFDIDQFAQTAEPYMEDLTDATELMADVGLL